MLYKAEQFPVEAVGFSETTTFDIPPTGKAFKSVIDGIYSRKIEAPIRELSTNAFDAHLAAGLIEPFRMKLPSKFDPMFMVRDFGYGMSHDFIMGTGAYAGGGFKALFYSTKDGDNKEVGMKGLGSKSPFAYTDAFILRIFSGETVRTYSTYIGENGRPHLAFQGETPSDERRGTAVQFPVQMKDIDEFYDAATRVLKGFAILPEGLPKTILDRLSGYTAEPLEQGTFWKTYRKEWLGEGAWAKQGCVLYPIDLEKITGAKWINTLGQCMVIEFPIGSVQMVDSREFLAYDEETIRNINDSVAKIKKEVDAKVDAMLSRATTNWELRLLFRNDMFSSLGPLARTSSRYNKINAINEFMKEALVRSKSARNTHKQIFYSVVRFGKKRDRDEDDKREVLVAYTRNDDNWSEKCLENPVFLYVGLDAKARRCMNARAGLYLKANPAVTGVIILEKLSLRTHRRLGKVKVMRITDMPELPAKPKVARPPVVWDRFKHFQTGSDYYIISEDEIEQIKDEGQIKLVYVFQNKGANFLPDATEEKGERLFNRGDLSLANKLLARYRDTKIVMINVRANEKMSRWPEAEFPRFDPDSTKDILRTLGRAEIIPLINVINHNRFSDSIYDRALDHIGTKRIAALRRRGQNNPLFDLDRFQKRRQQVKGEHHDVLNSVGSQGQEDIVERALELGLEVLPELMENDYWYQNSYFPYPLLAKKWERIAKVFGERKDQERRDAILDLALGGML